MLIAPRQDQHIFPAAATQLRWQADDFMAQRFHGRPQLCFRQAKPFKPVHDIIGEEQQLEKGDIGRPGLGGNLAVR